MVARAVSFLKVIIYSMNIRQNVSLREYSTMRLGGQAAFLAEIETKDDVVQAVGWAEQNNLPILVIGGGSNIFWRDEGFPGLILVNRIKRFEIYNEDDINSYVTIGAGEDWDSVVERIVANGLSGIECLSFVPGTAGATPIQNVGAYGQEISQTLVAVEAYELKTKSFINIPNVDCGLAYRTSRFKTTDKGKFLITSVTLHLMRTNPTPPFYPALQSYLEKQGTTEFTPKALRDAVIAIRQAKLPNPALVANNGSFFANPIINTGPANMLISDYPDMPHWPTDNGSVKVSAAWLITQAGFNDFHDPETGMATWPAQSLVFVNEKANSTADLLKFRQKVQDTVKAKFGIQLEQEPELLP
jgi:UDP-N-acetylmuramate dehydrogenase